MQHRKPMKLIYLTLFLMSISATVSGQSQILEPWSLDPSNYAARISSHDRRTGGNRDSIQILSGETVTLADISGAGIIRHIWITTSLKSPIGRMMVLRIYWDQTEVPAVEVPLGDFFGVGHGQEVNVNSWPITVGSNGKSKNCWWSMPFGNGAYITVENESPEAEPTFFYHIDYIVLEEPPTTERFHAQYRQAYPADFPENYTILDATGTGHYMGVVVNIETTESEWWGEGDELIEVDNHPPIYGTGTEDFFCDAWGIHQNMFLWHGAPVVEGDTAPGLRNSMYRFHILDPIPFKEKIHVSIGHGFNNERADNISSTVFWYQTPPAAPFPPMPPLSERLIGSD